MGERPRPTEQEGWAHAVELTPAGDDRALMLRAQNGDRAAFGDLVLRNQRPVHAYFQARLLQSNDADDLTQEVFLRCYQARARFDTQKLVRPYLMGIARIVLCEYARKLRRRKEIIWTEMCLELDDSSPVDEGTYENELDHLPACLGELGAGARRAVELYYGHRQPHAAIGEELKRSVGAVKLLLFRARRALKRCLHRKTKSSGNG